MTIKPDKRPPPPSPQVEEDIISMWWLLLIPVGPIVIWLTLLAIYHPK